MSRTVLMIVGIVAVLMGIAGLVPAWTLATEPAWHAVVKIIVGIIAVAVAASDKTGE